MNKDLFQNLICDLYRLNVCYYLYVYYHEPNFQKICYYIRSPLAFCVLSRNIRACIYEHYEKAHIKKNYSKFIASISKR